MEQIEVVLMACCVVSAIVTGIVVEIRRVEQVYREKSIWDVMIGAQLGFLFSVPLLLLISTTIHF